jgi:acetyl/propionyl-CoA carboxylase alpha subunit
MGQRMKPRPIKRLLIANRGEIVCRIISTARRMGIETVTVFAADDSALPHAQAGDINCLLEGETLAQTYLNIDQIIALAKRTKADAIHPGYGFLSENAAFAKAVAASGLVFVGPTADIIAQMGDKAASRKLCEKIKVPVIPGYHGDSQDVAVFAREAKKIGFPVLVKAAAGGGGKGMRVVQDAAGLKAALESARSEARNAFGNGRLLLEKYLVQPRHIEVQVFSDTQGHHIHLFERECSIQRRHQKIVEESPAPNLPAATRKQLYDAAVKIASHIGYIGAGTVEFILDSSGAFYFLEMNTRLQVEHPVTELVTGLDLVRMQLDVAQGKPLSVTQALVRQQGHAIEVRLYAEDAERDFLPATGELSVFSLPHAPHLRCENGYRAGNMVSPRYDPMIAKIAAGGATREEAIEALLHALNNTLIAGVTTNRAFLMRVLDAKPFRDGKTTTDFITRQAKHLAVPVPPDDGMAVLIAAYLLFGKGTQQAAGASSEEHSAWTSSRVAGFR